MGTITCLLITAEFWHWPDTQQHLWIYISAGRTAFICSSSVIKKCLLRHMNRPYLLILHLHFLPCPPHLPLPQCHYLPLHYQYHLLNPSYFHHCFLKKRRAEQRKYLFDADRQAEQVPELLIRSLRMNSQISAAVLKLPIWRNCRKHASLIHTRYKAKQNKKTDREKVTNGHKYIFTSLMRVNQ